MNSYVLGLIPNRCQKSYPKIHLRASFGATRTGRILVTPLNVIGMSVLPNTSKSCPAAVFRVVVVGLSLSCKSFISFLPPITVRCAPLSSNPITEIPSMSTFTNGLESLLRVMSIDAISDSPATSLLTRE
uniref:(northern house mosquito) hypothetical protein n=1 Tax=Culex pipiens TaxID=7175 RepID=A0A8D8L105_CULPI